MADCLSCYDLQPRYVLPQSNVSKCRGIFFDGTLVECCRWLPPSICDILRCIALFRELQLLRHWSVKRLRVRASTVLLKTTPQAITCKQVKQLSLLFCNLMFDLFRCDWVSVLLLGPASKVAPTPIKRVKMQGLISRAMTLKHLWSAAYCIQGLYYFAL